MDILYLSHCAPDAPDKGEKIRAYYIVRRLSRDYRLHVACLARSAAEAEGMRTAHPECASVHVEWEGRLPALARAAGRFLTGSSLCEAHAGNSRLAAYVRRLAATTPLAATVAYSSVMAPLAPAGVPLLLDLCDIDSEKWAYYAATRWPGALYGLEARRLRRQELAMIARASRCILATESEARLLNTFATGKSPLAVVESGVDIARYDPASIPPPDPAPARPYLVFVGQLNYYPNAQGALWFVREVLPVLRRRWPELEFRAVGRAPGAEVLALGNLPGVHIVDTPPDVRPWLASAAAVVTPLRMARGLQNKVLEALAMGKRVYATTEVCRTFGDSLPAGIIGWETPEQLAAALGADPWDSAPDPVIRAAAAAHYSWEAKEELFTQLVRETAASGRAGGTAPPPVVP